MPTPARAGRRSTFSIVKEFDEPWAHATAHRLGGLVPRQQNRDGAAIRHATAKLLEREARTKLLVLVSDGRPLDGDYKDDYSLEDTKAALREARQPGNRSLLCHDRSGGRCAMSGGCMAEVRFAVIDRVGIFADPVATNLSTIDDVGQVCPIRTRCTTHGSALALQVVYRPSISLCPSAWRSSARR